MKKFYGIQIDLIDTLYAWFFGLSCWLERRRKVALKRWNDARTVD